MQKKVSQHVTWVGKTDWQLTHFHGDELSTHFGSSYNSYLIRDKKTALIDTVWLPFDKEFVSGLKEVIDLKKIDYIIMNHNEIDHSGALVELMREIPEVPIYCTAKGESIIRGHYHQDWNFVNVKTGDTLSLGDTTLTFFEAPMLHWPDTMFTHLSGDNVLFSNDGFGQHYASESLFDDSVQDMEELLREAMKYYANILAPFSAMVKRKVAELLGMGLPLEIVAPSHGIIWKKHIDLIVGKYQQWCDNYAENRVTVVYDTMWNSTRRMAECIADGIRTASPETTVTLFNAAHTDKNDILTEIFRSKAVLVGSPTINNGLSYAMDGIMGMLKGLKLKGKCGAAFGSYGWSGEGPKLLSAKLEDAGFKVLSEGFKAQWVPDGEVEKQCREYGTAFMNAFKNN